MKKLALSNTGTYRVLVNNRVIFSGNEEEALDMIQELSLQYYESGEPDPSTVTLEQISYGETEGVPDGQETD